MPFDRRDVRPGARIANARGISGTLGFLALTLHDRRLVMVTSHHVLFGARGVEGDPVWLLAGDDVSRARVIARAAFGKFGGVRHEGRDTFVDAAVARVDVSDDELVGWRIDEDPAAATERPGPGEQVSKIGASTGWTHGVVVDADYSERARFDGVHRDAPGQILIRSAASGSPFSADGDSGAAVRNERGEIVAMLWGLTERGESVACPISPVLYVLNARVARVAPAPASETSASASVV